MDWINPTTVISTITGIAAIATILIVVGKWIGKREEFERTAKETFADINEALAEIRADIKKIFERLPVPVSTKKSPIRLTEFGQTVSDYLKAQQWAEETARKVSPEIASLTPYAIQEYGYRFVKQDERFPTEDMRLKMEDAAYTHGVEMQAIHEVLAIELRDELLKLRGFPTPE